MSEQKEQSWCHCSLSGVEPTCGKPMVDDGTDFCENRLPDGTYCAHRHACHSLSDQAEPGPINYRAHSEALAEALRDVSEEWAQCVGYNNFDELCADSGSKTYLANAVEQALAAFDQDRGSK